MRQRRWIRLTDDSNDSTLTPVKQLLVRGLDERVVRRLKARARAHGVSAEEEHRRILREVLLREPPGKPTLVEYLISEAGAVHPETELELDRDRGGSRSGTGV